MKWRKMVAVIIAVTSVIGCHVNQVHAVSLSPENMNLISDGAAVPNWVSIYHVLLNIDHSGTNISVSLSILPINSGTATVGTLRIEEYANGKWSRVKYWHIDTVGTVNMSKSYIGQTGHTYRARVVVTSGSDNIDKKTSGMTV